MTDEEAARAIVALEGWRWVQGMLALPPQADRCQRDSQMMSGRLPDPDDPATAGCLAQRGYDAGWLFGIDRFVREAGNFYGVRFLHPDGQNLRTKHRTSPGRAVATAAIARGTWL